MIKRILSIVLVAILLFTMTASASSIKILRVNNDYARLRSGGSSSNSVVRKLRTGEYVMYLGKRNDAFYKVCTFKGDTGWVYGGYLTTKATVNSSKLYFVKSGAKVYAQPKTSSKRLATASKKTCVIVGVMQNGWALIKNINGATGYIQTKYLSRVF